MPESYGVITLFGLQDLQKELADRGLRTTGKVTELRARLDDADPEWATKRLAGTKTSSAPPVDAASDDSEDDEFEDREVPSSQFTLLHRLNIEVCSKACMPTGVVALRL